MFSGDLNIGVFFGDQDLNVSLYLDIADFHLHHRAYYSGQDND